MSFLVQTALIRLRVLVKPSVNKGYVMQFKNALIFTMTGLISSLTVYAADDFVPETFTVKKSIDAGPNAYLIDQNWYDSKNI